MKSSVYVLLAIYLTGTTAQYPLKFLDCPGNRGIFGILRRCCNSEQLPNDCECFDISRDSGFINTAFNKPQCPKDIDVTFTLYTRANRVGGTLLGAGSSFPTGSTFDGSKPTKFLTHGFTDTAVTGWALEIKDAFLDLENVNFIAVDWQRGARAPNYYLAAANTRTVGAMVARLILDMNSDHGASFDNLHLIGHSLGSHVMGSAGEEIKRLTGQQVSRITGLDPAGPSFERYLPWVRLDPTDAQFVDVIHTDAENLISSGFGIRISVGDVDFWPNGGKHQLGCPEETYGILSMASFTDEKSHGVCSHGRAIDLFLSSLTGCTWGDTCTMGYSVSRDCRGDYYPTTTSEWPFC